MRVCAGIILFFPDIERLKKNIAAVSQQVDKLFIINNAFEDTDRLIEAFSDRCIDWIHNDKNLGIAGALNQLMNYADNQGYQWILTLDQDGVCSDGLVDKLADAAKHYSNAAMVSPRIIERGLEWDVHKRIDDESNSDIGEVLFCITSGTLTNVKAVLDAGGFDEKLFIDDVDHDMCIRLRYRGYKLLKVFTAELYHEFGLELVHRRVLFKVFKYRNYSPFRVYYQTRNKIYMLRKYGSDYIPYPIFHFFRPFIAFTVKFIFEAERLKRLSAFAGGYWAGLFMRK